MSDQDVHRIARAYDALDDLDRVLRAGAPADEFTTPKMQEWLQTNVAQDVEAAMKIVGRLTSLDEETISERVTMAREHSSKST